MNSETQTVGSRGRLPMLHMSSPIFKNRLLQSFALRKTLRRRAFFSLGYLVSRKPGWANLEKWHICCDYPSAGSRSNNVP